MEFHEGHEPEDCRICIDVESERRLQIRAFAHWQREAGRPSLFNVWSQYVNQLIRVFKREAQRG